jgi:8-oxo-dGTP diphosphatase
VGRFHYLVRAVITDGDGVLLARQIGADNTFLPGGHIDFGEPAKSALWREIREETGLSVEIGEFLGAVEATWQDTDLNAEVNLFFAATLPSGTAGDVIRSKEAHLEFLWVQRSNLDSYNLLPAPMRRLIQEELKNTRAFWGSAME